MFLGSGRFWDMECREFRKIVVNCEEVCGRVIVICLETRSITTLCSYYTIRSLPVSVC